MYQHPQALDMNAQHYQQEALRNATSRRLAREAHDADEHSGHVLGTSPFQRRMVAVAAALVTVMGVIALI